MVCCLRHRRPQLESVSARASPRWSLALRAFPRARFLAKTDDDSLNNFANLAAILTAPSLASNGPEQLLCALPRSAAPRL